MSLSQCLMSSIVAVSFLCKKRNNEALFPLAFSKGMLAEGLGAALAVVELGIFFGQLHVFTMDAVYLIPDSQIGRAPGPPTERRTRSRDSMVLEDCPPGSWGRFYYPPALFVCSANE